MKKLMLDVEALQVESFPTADASEARGTVQGMDGAATVPPYCMTFTCGDSMIRPCRD